MCKVREMIEIFLKLMLSILSGMLSIKSMKDNDITKTIYWIMVCIYWVLNLIVSLL